MSLIYTAPAGVSSPSGLYIGGKKEAKSRSTLERLGITHVLNVTPPKDSSIQAGVPNYFESKVGGASKIVYRRVPVYDTATSDLLSQADAIVGFISSGLHHGSVLVHCKEGISRSTTCVIFFLMRKLGMTYADAFELCKRKRPVAQPIPSFIAQCRKYEQKCLDLGVIRSSNSSKKRKMGPSIGPAIGPSIRPESPAAAPQKRIAENRSGAAIGPAAEPKNETIAAGPTIRTITGRPTCMSDTGIGVAKAVENDSDDDDDDDNRKRESKKAKIGPALPHIPG